MKSLIFLSLLLVSAFSVQMEANILRDLFDQWKIINSVTYSSEFEHDQRFSIFAENYLAITNFNAQSDSAFLVLNRFADLTQDEFSALYTGLIPSTNRLKAETYIFDVDAGDFPASIDWRAQGAVTPVKNESQCGSCWAFAATGALEGLYFINNSKLVSFSEQYLIDCDFNDFGCEGGEASDALEFVGQYGIQSEDDYPYVGETQNCTSNASRIYNVSDGYYYVPPQNLPAIKAALVSQPVSVGVAASSIAFRFYGGGVIKMLCGDSIDHAVLVVGYEVIKDTEAFIVKNSWGANWGNEGYVYISTNENANGGEGVCGILIQPVIPFKN